MNATLEGRKTYMFTKNKRKISMKERKEKIKKHLKKEQELQRQLSKKKGKAKTKGFVKSQEAVSSKKTEKSPFAFFSTVGEQNSSAKQGRERESRLPKYGTEKCPNLAEEKCSKIDLLQYYKDEVLKPFPQICLDAAKKFPRFIGAKTLEKEIKRGRRDLRTLPTLTIDGRDAKDLDDALSIQEEYHLLQDIQTLRTKGIFSLASSSLSSLVEGQIKKKQVGIVADDLVLKEDLEVNVKPDEKLGLCNKKGKKQEKERCFRLWVHIADVSHYVQENDVLDLEAQARTSSMYFTKQVLPMLPPALSNGLCSLHPHCNRLTLTVEMLFDQKAELLGAEVYESIIRSDLRADYDTIYQWGEKGGKLPRAYQGLEKELQCLKDFAFLRFKASERRGAFSFDLPEVKLVFPQEQERKYAWDTVEAASVEKENQIEAEQEESISDFGKALLEELHEASLENLKDQAEEKDFLYARGKEFVSSSLSEDHFSSSQDALSSETLGVSTFSFPTEKHYIKEVYSTWANQLIEECMVQANFFVALLAEKAELPFLYRIHQEPEFEQLLPFLTIASALGKKFKVRKQRGAKAWQTMIKNLQATHQHYLSVAKEKVDKLYQDWRIFALEKIKQISENTPEEVFTFFSQDKSKMGKQVRPAEEYAKKARRKERRLKYWTTLLQRKVERADEKIEILLLCMDKLTFHHRMGLWEYANFLTKAREAQSLLQIFLRSMTKARYSQENIGHYGLALRHYSHFTSPIRRYPDLFNHRMLKKYLLQQSRQSQEREFQNLPIRHESLKATQERTPGDMVRYNHLSRPIAEQIKEQEQLEAQEKNFLDLQKERTFEVYPRKYVGVENENLTQSQESKLAQYLADQCSKGERRALLLEREEFSRTSAELYAPALGNIYLATITGFTSTGFFVRLLNGLEGMISFHQLPAYMIFNPNIMQAKPKKKKKKQKVYVGEIAEKKQLNELAFSSMLNLRLGKTVLVQLSKVNTERGLLDFQLVFTYYQEQYLAEKQAFHYEVEKQKKKKDVKEEKEYLKQFVQQAMLEQEERAKAKKGSKKE